MNNSFYNDLNENFEQAYLLSEKEFSHSELVNMLKNGNIPQKQIAALKFDFVNSQDDAEILIQNLTGCDGKIREAVALKINQLLLNSNKIQEFFLPYSKIFANATIDINGNICRLVTDSVAYLSSYENFAQEYSNCIIKFTQQALEELDKFVFRDKKYVINKQLFKLYWCLETLKNFYYYIEEDQLKQLLEKSIEQKEYTIREKVAQLIKISNKFNYLKQRLINDENYYVRAVF